MKIKGVKCLKCGKKTLSHPESKLWSAWKDTTRAYCRSCGTKFKKTKGEKE